AHAMNTSPSRASDHSSTSAGKSGWRAFWRDHRRAILVVAAIAIGIAVFWGQIDLEALHDWAEHVSPIWLFVALVLLPLTTFPVTPLNIIAGIRFGFVGGLAMVAGAIVLQHALAYFTAWILPRVLKKRLEPLRAKLPRNAHGDAVIFTSLLPGAPYWAQLYVLPL